MLRRSRTSCRVARSGLLSVGAILMALSPSPLSAQQASPKCSEGVTVAGTVRNLDGQLVKNVVVHLSSVRPGADLETKTDADGRFVFSPIDGVSFRLRAQTGGMHSQSTEVTPLPRKCKLQVELRLHASEPSTPSGKASAPIAQAMEFADQPNFTIAGVTDWTAVGGHGSDSTLRTTETLASETRSLKQQGADGAPSDSAPKIGDKVASEAELRAAVDHAPTSFRANHELGIFYLNERRYAEAIPLLEGAYKVEPTNETNQYDLGRAYEGAGDLPRARKRVQEFLAMQKSADLLRLAAELDEQLGDPLSAVREYEEAAKLNPSEQNYFEWGSELLLHRAVWQALEVLRRGADAYPRSVRMQTALGTALFAGARYDQAAERLCAASDLNPEDPDAYVFMGKVQMAAPNPLPCVEPRLARFVQQQPGNSEANYLYAMTMLKHQEQRPDAKAVEQAKALLTKAVSVDPNCGEGFLELGNLAASERSFEAAIAFYKKAIVADPQLADAHYRLGMAYDRTAQPAKAKQEFQLHDQIKQQQAEATEKQRRDVKQFLVVLPGSADGTGVH
jgi:tetratricopeptide (TPR) repeat protein